jgi:hypothetical protein
MKTIYQAVPLPVSALEKLDEAGFFFNTMLKHRANARLVPYYLNAFLAAFRSTEYYLRNQNRSDPRFAIWIETRIASLKKDPGIAHLISARHKSIHEKPLDTVFMSVSPRLVSTVIETTDFSMTHGFEDDGSISVRYRIGEHGEWISSEPVVNWYFEIPEQVEMFSLCYRGLEEAYKLISDWEQIRVLKSSGTAR